MERGGLTVNRTDFLTHYLQSLERRCGQAAGDFEAMKQEAWQRSWLAGKRVTLTTAGEERQGVVDGLGPEGELLLKRDDGAVEVIASADLVRPVAD
jgi:biotin-(acetyl-CoA carboxylase) ligase